jgi:hypothetical protein
MKVIGSKNVIENDTTPDKETRLYTVMVLECRNESCTEFKKPTELFIDQPVG